MQKKKALHSLTIAIDGYSSCGKSTLAKAISKVLKLNFVDTGAMYRAVTVFALQHRCVMDDKVNVKKLIERLPEIEISFGKKNDDESQPMLLNGKDVSKEIRSYEVSQIVSEVAAIKEVRLKLVEQQQQMGLKGGVVMDGRDIGTVVFPKADVKLFLTADEDIRVMRRYNELKAKGEVWSIDAVKENLAHRDYVDTHREDGPLRQASDAIVINNSELNREEQLELALSIIENSLILG